jgi:hypothetical protein
VIFLTRDEAAIFEILVGYGISGVETAEIFWRFSSSGRDYHEIQTLISSSLVPS